MTPDVVSARLEWENAYRTLLDAAEDSTQADGLRLQLETVTSELRRRVGGTFTLPELAAEYVRSDAWTRHVLAQQATPGWPLTLSVVEGAAFHMYSRGATDYAP